jgi:hypothetical protein
MLGLVGGFAAIWYLVPWGVAILGLVWSGLHQAFASLIPVPNFESSVLLDVWYRNYAALGDSRILEALRTISAGGLVIAIWNILTKV